MEKIAVTSALDRLALWSDYIIACDDMKLVTVPLKEKWAGKYQPVQRRIELTNPIEYTREELLKKYDGKTRISRWDYTYTESGEPAVAVVIEKNSN